MSTLCADSLLNVLIFQMWIQKSKWRAILSSFYLLFVHWNMRVDMLSFHIFTLCSAALAPLIYKFLPKSLVTRTNSYTRPKEVTCDIWSRNQHRVKKLYSSFCIFSRKDRVLFKRNRQIWGKLIIISGRYRLDNDTKPTFHVQVRGGVLIFPPRKVNFPG